MSNTGVTDMERATTHLLEARELGGREVERNVERREVEHRTALVHGIRERVDRVGLERAAGLGETDRHLLDDLLLE